MGASKEDIYDIGLVTNDQNIPVPDNARRIAAPHLSCLWSARYINSTMLECYISVLHGGYRNENGTINRSLQRNVRGGYAYIHTYTNGLGFNRNAVFRFNTDCKVITDRKECRTRGCYWCLYNTQCFPNDSYCLENCATESVQMSCGEFRGIVAASVVVALLIALIGLFVRYQSVQARLRLGYRDPKDRLLRGHDRYSSIDSSSLATFPENLTTEDDEDDALVDANNHDILAERKHNLLKQPNKLTSFF